MGWLTRSFRSCLPLHRQQPAPYEGTIRSGNRVHQEHTQQQTQLTWEEDLAIMGDMQLGISRFHWMSYTDDMTHEELLELDEGFDDQRSGLSEKTISSCLITRIIHIESSASRDQNQETELCVICQYEYESQEKVATLLDCGHEYHKDCIKQWLRCKNVCPICKCPAL